MRVTVSPVEPSLATPWGAKRATCFAVASGVARARTSGAAAAAAAGEASAAATCDGLAIGAAHVKLLQTYRPGFVFPDKSGRALDPCPSPCATIRFGR